MANSIDIILTLMILADLLLLGLDRLRTCVRTAAVQGALLSLLPIALNGWRPELHTLILGSLLLILKGFVFPAILYRTMREIESEREVEPLVGFGMSIFFGTAALIFSFVFGSRLPLPFPTGHPLIVPSAMFTLLTGLFLIVSRRKAITQVIGYLVMENGIYSFGAVLAGQQPLLIELGILLDVFVGVFVMGIAIFHINREFNHIDTDKMSQLRS